MINKDIIQITLTFSFIIGCILGVLALIPPFMWISFLLLMFFTSVFVLIYLKKLNIIKTLDTRTCMVLGGVSGTGAFLGFSLLLFPLGCVLNLIFKIQSFIWIKVIFLNFLFLISMVVFMSLLGALLNSFSGFLCAYFSNSFKK